MRICVLLFVTVLSSCKATDKTVVVPTDDYYFTYYDSGKIKEKGKLSKNDLPYNELRVGHWEEYYENGNLKSKGLYDFDSYTNCCIAGPCQIWYNYKVGYWKFYYPNNSIKAKGVFSLDNFHIDTTCEGGDQTIFGEINENWIFLDELGVRIEPNEDLLEEIEITKANGDFPEMLLRVNKENKTIERSNF